MRAYATVQKLLCHGSYCELILSLMRASYRLSFAAQSCRPSCCLGKTRRPTLFAQESTLDHDAVAAAVSHKHHSIIRVGAGFIQFVYGSHLRLATGVTSSIILFSPFLRKQFQDVVQKYPRWMENTFTRNTVQSNMQYMEFMTLSHTWSENQWDAPPFNLFCQKPHRELGSLLTACDIIPAPLAALKLVVQEVCEENAHNISDIGYKFGHTMDDGALEH